MATRPKTPSLTEHLATKPAAALRAVEGEGTSPPPSPRSKASRIGDNTRHRRGIAADGRIGQTLRLNPEAWEQLKILATKERVNAHDLVVEGVNLLFRDRGLPEIG